MHIVLIVNYWIVLTYLRLAVPFTLSVHSWIVLILLESGCFIHFCWVCTFNMDFCEEEERISVLKEGGSLNEDTAAINRDIGKSVLVYAQWHHDIKTT